MSETANPLRTEQASAPLTGRKRRQGLRKPSAGLISKAIDETNTQVTRIGLTFLGASAFCILSLFSPDSSLLGGTERINVPLAGPVSFFGFVLLGPAILIMLRIYLQIYVEHSARLERIGRSMLTERPPTLVPLKNRLMRAFGGFTFYLVLPFAMMFFAWKGAVFTAWGSGLICVAAAIIACHATLPIGNMSWGSRAFTSIVAAIIAGVIMFTFGAPRRPFELHRANLSNQSLVGFDFSGAVLNLSNLSNADLTFGNLSKARMFRANLSGAELPRAKMGDADLSNAKLSNARLIHAELQGADFTFADLSNADLLRAVLMKANLYAAKLTNANLDGASLNGATLSYADLNGANLKGANLDSANLKGANLSNADLSFVLLLKAKDLSEACGNESTKLPNGFTVKPCPDQR